MTTLTARKYYPFIDGLCSSCFDILAWKFDRVDRAYEVYDLLTTGMTSLWTNTGHAPGSRLKT